jgi:hypothetical protein
MHGDISRRMPEETFFGRLVTGWAVSDTQARAAVAPPPTLGERRHRRFARGPHSHARRVVCRRLPAPAPLGMRCSRTALIPAIAPLRV